MAKDLFANLDLNLLRTFIILNQERNMRKAADWNSNQSMSEKMIRMRGHDPKIVFRSELPSAIVDVVKHSDMMFPGSSFLNLDTHPGLRSLDIYYGSATVDTDINAFYHYKNRNSATTL